MAVVAGSYAAALGYFALPGGPRFDGSPLSPIALTLLLVIALARRMRAAWWVAVLFAVFTAVVVPLAATPHGMARIAPLVALAVIQLVALWSPAMRQETPRRDDDPVGHS